MHLPLLKYPSNFETSSMQTFSLDYKKNSLFSECAWWAEIGECTVNPMYMLISCAQSCKSCGTKYEDIPPVKQDCLDKSR